MPRSNQTKRLLAQSLMDLMMTTPLEKISVNDIVDHAGVGRNTFYYHFEDIPDLIQWVLYQEMEIVLEECIAKKDLEKGLRHFFEIAIQLQPYAIRGMQSNYGDEIGRMLEQVFYDLFEKVTEMQHWYEGYSDKDREFILHYHCQAVMGLLREWTKQDTENISYIVHQIYLLLMGKAVLVSDENNDLKNIRSVKFFYTADILSISAKQIFAKMV